jgi:hypothetical protein
MFVWLWRGILLNFTPNTNFIKLDGWNMNYEDEIVTRALDRRKHILSEYLEHVEVVAINGSLKEGQRAKSDFRHLEFIFSSVLQKRPVTKEQLSRRKFILQDYRNCADMMFLNGGLECAKISESDYQSLELFLMSLEKLH